MNSLYKILEQYREIEQELIDSEGVISQELEDRMAINQADFKEKMSNYAMVIAEQQGYADNIEAEIFRLVGLKRKREALIDSLKERMKEALLIYGEQDKKGIYRMDTGLFKFSSRKSTRVEIVEPDKIDKRFYVFPEPPAPYISKTLIADAMKDGVVEGATIVTNYGITIK